jgi:glycosyltransferase involved in cell wall biosynthesis
MRITFLLPRYGWRPSGGYSVVYTYASRLAARGHTVHVVHPRRLPPGGWPQPASPFGRLRWAAGRMRDRLMRPRLEWAPRDPRVQLLYVPEIAARWIPDADAVVATWWSTAEAALTLPSSKGERYHLIQGYETWYGMEERVHAAWRAPLRKIFISRWLQQCALELGVRECDTTVIPNAIDHDVFRLLRPIENRPRRVALLYSSVAFKGSDLGIEILQRARERVPQLTARVAGFGARPQGLPRWMEYVRGATMQRLALDVYSSCAVYLCASRSEGWHLPNVEAMACGCAVASSDLGGVRDYAIDGETALLYPPGDVAAGAECIIQLLLDETRRVKLAQQALHRVRAYSWDWNVDCLETLLASGTPEALNGTRAER